MTVPASPQATSPPRRGPGVTSRVVPPSRSVTVEPSVRRALSSDRCRGCAARRSGWTARRRVRPGSGHVGDRLRSRQRHRRSNRGHGAGCSPQTHPTIFTHPDRCGHPRPPGARRCRFRHPAMPHSTACAEGMSPRPTRRRSPSNSTHSTRPATAAAARTGAAPTTTSRRRPRCSPSSPGTTRRIPTVPSAAVSDACAGDSCRPSPKRWAEAHR